MNTSQYLDFASKHLPDRDTYQPLMADPTQEIVEQFNRYLTTCLRSGVVTQSQYDKLYVQSNVDTQSMYFLPKVHKDPVNLDLLYLVLVDPLVPLRHT